jgi:phage terminase large subunit
MKDLSKKMEDIGLKKNYDVIVADCEDPDHIDELCGYGWNVQPCIKGPGSVEFGHQKVNQYIQHWTSSSVNCVKEQRNFMFIKNKDGEFTEKTTHFFSHGMDARRYAITGLEHVTGYNLSTMGSLD